MDCRMKASLILLVFFLLQIHAKGATNDKDLELERQRRMLSKHKITSIKIGNSDMFDCVDIYKQPAFDHPQLVNHTIQLKPSSALKDLMSTSSKTTESSDHAKDSCPPGTVPIWRTSKKDLFTMRKHAQQLKVKSLHQINDYNAHDDEGTFQAVALVSPQSEYYGAEALMDVYNVPNILDDQTSNAQVILINGQDGPEDHINTIQFGWTVDYGLNGDKAPRLFVVWTSDDYQKTGCANTLCPGYVQVSKNIFPGMVLSAGKGVIKLRVFRDPSSGNWQFLSVANGGTELIGYFPKEIFNNMGNASQVQVGGIAYAAGPNERMPPMGSGVRPGDGGDVCKFKEVAMLDESGDAGESATILSFVTRPDLNLYGVLIEPVSVDGTDLYEIAFGGPGGDRSKGI